MLTVAASRAAEGPMVVIFHLMVNSKAELEGETIADQAMAVIFSTIAVLNQVEQQAHFPTPALPIIQLGQTGGLLNSQVILSIR